MQLSEDFNRAGYSPIVAYDKLVYDVTAVLQLKVEGHALPEIAEKLRQKEQMVTVYEVTGDADIIVIGEFTDTDGMNDQIKSLLTDTDIRESTTNVVLKAVTENEQFELDVEGFQRSTVPLRIRCPPVQRVAHG